jgi:hypothetical protein
MGIPQVRGNPRVIIFVFGTRQHVKFNEPALSSVKRTEVNKYMFRSFIFWLPPKLCKYMVLTETTNTFITLKQNARIILHDL